jgi:serine/threonine-protein kinase
MSEAFSPATIGRYEIVRLVGRGGMALVYEARDATLGRRVALKVLRTDVASPRLVDRLHREAEAVARLRHPGIVTVHDVGEANGYHFIAMDFVDGATFGDVAPAMPPRRRLEALESVARAVAHAHAHGIVHRDLKPANVLVESANGRLYLTDFGLARLVDGEALTRSGSAVGTPQYMAPEQVRGESRLIGPATDVWALGVLLYELIEGRAPFHGPTPAVLFQALLVDDPPRLTHASRDLSAVCLKSLEKEPSRRYRDAGAFADDLRRAIDGEPVQARPASFTYRVTRRIRRRPLPFVLAASALAVAMAVAVAVTVQGARARRAAKAESEAILRALPPQRGAAIEALVRADHLARGVGDDDLRYRVSCRLGELALDGANYDLARLAFGTCDALRPGEGLPALVDEHAQASARKRRERILAILDDVRAGLSRAGRPPDGSLLEDYVLECVQYADDQTARLLGEALDRYASRAAPGVVWSQEDRDVMTLAFRVLGRIDRDAALAPLARLLGPLRDERLLVECGEALCNTRRAEALAPLLLLRARVGSDSTVWQQVTRFLPRIPRALQAEPRTAAEWVMRGELRLDGGDLDGAAADFDRAIEADAGVAAAWGDRGVARARQGRTAEALADFDRALAIDPALFMTRANRAKVLFDLGRQDEAIEECGRAIAIEPNQADAVITRGMARHAKGDHDGAVADFERALELDPRSVSARINRGNAHRVRGRLAEALADYNAALELDPRSATAFLNRAVTHELAGRRPAALADLERSLELDPRCAIAYYNRGCLRQIEGRFDDAVADFDRMLAIQPDDVSGLVNRGIAHSRAGRQEPALADLTRAITVDPRCSFAYFNRAHVRTLAGDTAGAVADYERFLKLAPDDPDAPEVRRRLKALRP